MSKRNFKSQASSVRVESELSASGTSNFGWTKSSPLSYIQEPPDYGEIRDANIVVAFKNLSKKDPTTKSKALEDIQSHFGSTASGIEDGLLKAWVQVYPRLSIDSARRVRQLAHSLNGQICLKVGKRSAKYLPRLAGAWLAGTHDFDRAAAKSAQDALNLVFPGIDKIEGLRKTFQRSILEYCLDAAFRETVQTLSDERTVSPDDAHATYCRVVATSIAVVSSLLNDLSQEEISKHQLWYDDMFKDAKLWGFVTHSDAGVRRSVHRLIHISTLKQPKEIVRNVQAASYAFVYKALASDQSGSAVDFVQTLIALTSLEPGLWTDFYRGKKSVCSRLQQFLKQGSQGGATNVWESLGYLFQKLPDQIWPSLYDEAARLLLALRDGVTKKEERFSAAAAWQAYFTLTDELSARLPNNESEKLIDTFVMPLIRQYLSPEPDTAEWSISNANSAAIVSKVLLVRRLVASSLEREWPSLAENLIVTAKMSQPQQSKDFDKSQTHVASAGERWADLQRELFESEAMTSDSLRKVFVASNTKIAVDCIKLLTARDGKPFGAAAIIEWQLHHYASQLLEDYQFKATMQEFLQTNAPPLILGPSRRHLVRILYVFKFENYFASVFNGMLRTILSQNESTQVVSQMLEDLLSPNTPDEAVHVLRRASELQDFVGNFDVSCWGSSSMALLSHLMKLGAVLDEVSLRVLSRLVESLNVEDEAKAGVDGLILLSNSDESTMKALMVRPDGIGSQLLPNLLHLEQSADDDVSLKAARLSSKLSSASDGLGTDTRYNVLKQNLETISQTSLSMDAIHELTIRLLGQDHKIDAPADLLPDIDIFLSALRTILRPPPVSLALLSPLGGAVHLVDPVQSTYPTSIQVDGEGFSQALRIAMYLSRLFAKTNLMDSLAQLGSTKQYILAAFYITVLLAEDNLSVVGANGLWHPHSGEDTEAAVLEFVSEAHAILRIYWNEMMPNIASDTDSVENGSSKYTRFRITLDQLLSSEGPNSTLAYYLHVASSKLHVSLFEVHGHSADQAKASEAVLQQHKLENDSLATMAVIVGLQQPLRNTSTILKFCNELVAGLTDADCFTATHQALEKILLLNSILGSQEDVLSNIAKQRLVFLVKNLIPVISGDVSLAIKAEICKAFTFLLPAMQDVYGEHWSQVLTCILTLWTSPEVKERDVPDSEHHLLLEHASLRLYATLTKLSKFDEPNDDLLDALKDNQDQIYDGLVQLLESADGVADDKHQPLMITNELLGRQIAELPQSTKQIVDELYNLLYAPSRPVQQAAFALLHQHIPAIQEQVAFDAALDDKTAHLPDELLSLILEAPNQDSLAAASFDRIMPPQLQGYLYSWRLLFDHFTGSSHRVKTDYIDQLKDGTYINGLLSLTFDFLGHSRGKPVDASKIDIHEYIANTEPSPEKDVQWLLTHLYYLALMHLPSLVRTYFLDVRSRQTSLAIESWTAKYVSPHVINNSLQDVAQWAEKSLKDDPDQGKMSIKVGTKSKEINVSYVVDEQVMAIRVVLPEAYPLASVQVVGVSRVGVKEERWQSWLRNCQGVITFSNGSIADGLFAWRKNVTGALKGQSECAICYSIISADKQLPTKKCPTCKNLFHSSCLFKWFKTSNASTCPLCRNAFNFN